MLAICREGFAVNTISSFFFFDASSCLWVAYCVEYDLDVPASSLDASWQGLGSACNTYLDWCFENGQNEVHPNPVFQQLFEQSEKKFFGEQKLNWFDIHLKSYKLLDPRGPQPIQMALDF